REARPRRLAPSHLVKQDGGQWTGKLDPILARKRGEAVHVLLERLPGTTEDRWPKLAKALIGQRVPGLGSELGQEAIAEAFAVLQDDTLAWIFGPGSLSEVGVSLPVIPGATAMHGRMDRLIVSEHQVTIVDFKSDQAVPLDAVGVAQGYLAQLGAYRAALSPLYPDRPVTTGLLWTRARQFMALSDAHVDAAYQEALAGIDLGATGS
ncbi:MAG: PD-(D/E)XK nuclease family protein, partial [Pseudomonadota bacterium]